MLPPPEKVDNRTSIVKGNSHNNMLILLFISSINGIFQIK